MGKTPPRDGASASSFKERDFQKREKINIITTEPRRSHPKSLLVALDQTPANILEHVGKCGMVTHSWLES